jgi:hypothetical protein
MHPVEQNPISDPTSNTAQDSTKASKSTTFNGVLFHSNKTLGGTIYYVCGNKRYIDESYHTEH